MINGHQTKELTAEDEGLSLAEIYLAGYNGPLALTDKLTAELLMISKRLVDDLIQSRKLVSVKIHGARRITIWSIVDYLQKLEAEQAL